MTSHPSSVSSNSLATPSKCILITSEGGSISLRTREEGGGAYGHHASKAAANMVGKVLANDLYEKGITMAMINVSDWRLLPLVPKISRVRGSTKCADGPHVARLHEDRHDEVGWL